MSQENTIEKDKKLLISLGGYSKVAKLTDNSPQCVFNWSARGIPAKVKLKYPDLFLRDLAEKSDAV